MIAIVWQLEIRSGREKEFDAMRQALRAIGPRPAA
jgi:hypothetical protein